MTAEATKPDITVRCVPRRASMEMKLLKVPPHLSDKQAKKRASRMLSNPGEYEMFVVRQHGT